MPERACGHDAEDRVGPHPFPMFDDDYAEPPAWEEHRHLLDRGMPDWCGRLLSFGVAVLLFAAFPERLAEGWSWRGAAMVVGTAAAAAAGGIVHMLALIADRLLFIAHVLTEQRRGGRG